MKIILPTKVREIINIFQGNGFEAYVVGGCVRDSILGKEPEDWDITTSATPLQTKELFKRTFDTGIEHGTVTVLMDKDSYEVTTYRIDGIYNDNRHPSGVQFTRSLEEDLLRRDFTINAMAYNDKDGLVDIFGGIKDLEKGIIRCVGIPKERFQEDALRILRAVRFAAQLGFEMEADTKTAAKKLVLTLNRISAERIQAELVKTLISPHPELLYMMYEMGITGVVLPEFDLLMNTEQENQNHCYNVGWHTIKAIGVIKPDKVLRLTMLLHDMGKPSTKIIDNKGEAHFVGHEIKSEEIAREILRRLKFDNETIKNVCCLVKYHDYRMPVQDSSVRKAMNKIGSNQFLNYLEIRRADTLAQSEYKRNEKLQVIKEIEETYREILERKECVSLKELAISGKDLIQEGVKPGKEIGKILERLLALVLENPDCNTRAFLMSYLRKEI